MSIRFAAPPQAMSARLSEEQVRAFARRPANDDQEVGADEAMLRAALRHFADHGLAAASHARRRAETAFFAGDREAYRWWLGICRTLDRRMARELATTTKNAR
ncbi:hypothetical protein [Croceibacterium soli]|uniref:hypothetical protein n=1 Tax=Croceibacterium soli TaxID=1739690 RepID=UPI001F1B575F|nr:hypothetical protein [Croceibacterium soli]